LSVIAENKIKFRINGDAEGYQQILFENGAMVIQCKPTNLWTNIDNIRNAKIEELIPSNGTYHTRYLYLITRITTRITKKYQR
jgi:hypothetical protein